MSESPICSKWKAPSLARTTAAVVHQRLTLRDRSTPAESIFSRILLLAKAASSFNGLSLSLNSSFAMEEASKPPLFPSSSKNLSNAFAPSKTPKTLSEMRRESSFFEPSSISFSTFIQSSSLAQSLCYPLRLFEDLEKSCLVHHLGGVRGVGFGLARRAREEEIGLGVDDEMMVRVRGPEHLLLGHEDLVDLLARADAHDLGGVGLVAGGALRVGAREVHDPAGRGLLHEDLAALRVREGVEHEVHGLGEREHEAGHELVSDAERLFLRDEALQGGDHGAAGADHVAVAHAGEGGLVVPAAVR